MAKAKTRKPDAAERIVLREFNYNGYASCSLNALGRQRCVDKLHRDTSAEAVRLRCVARRIRAALRRSFAEGALHHALLALVSEYAVKRRKELASKYGVRP